MAVAVVRLSLPELATSQGGVVTRVQLVAGLGQAGCRRALRAEEWLAVRRGAYAERTDVDAARDDTALRHRLDCAAQVLLSGRDLVVSHRSAAVLHGLRLLDAHTGRPELTLPRPPGTPPAHVRGLHAASLPATHRQLLRGVPVTTPPRTVADCARGLPRPPAIVLADAALRRGVDRDAVLEVLSDCRHWPGVASAYDVVRFADARAESALESLARVWFDDAGLPAPQLQVGLCTSADGRFIARVDFFWPQQRTVCEVDGRVKYAAGAQEQAGASAPSGSLWHEKLREDALRDLGLEVVRGYWSDGRDRGRSLVERVQRAYARAALRRDAPTYGVLTSP